MRSTRAWGRAVRGTWVLLVLAAPASACPLCTRTDAESGGPAAKGFAMAGGLLLAGPFVLAGVFGLLLGRTLASAGAPAVKEPT
jgi:hypothetical protein